MTLIWPYIVLILLGCGWGLTIPLTVIAVKTGLGHLGIIFWQFFIVMVLFSLRQIFKKAVNFEKFPASFLRNCLHWNNIP